MNSKIIEKDISEINIKIEEFKREEEQYKIYELYLSATHKDGLSYSLMQEIRCESI